MKDIQSRPNDIRKGRQGLGGGEPLIDSGLSSSVDTTQKMVFSPNCTTNQETKRKRLVLTKL